MEFNVAYLMLMLLAFNIVGSTHASDPDIISDFVLPPGQNPANVDGNFFTFTGLRQDYKNYAFAVSGFGSANAGTVSLPSTLFTSGISSDVLAMSFKTDAKTIDMLKASLKA
ncbi:hypothetical protein SUGI_1005130 [Cryptomeria japonica]|nr:hypothetical protein SUGI_1005130 [Cryptomeria japonica]